VLKIVCQIKFLHLILFSCIIPFKNSFLLNLDMPVPKQKHSPARSKRDRNQWVFCLARKLQKKIALTHCAECKGLKKMHFACPHCGSYGKRSVFTSNTSEATKASGSDKNVTVVKA
jgi:ribosomal protein L32